MATKRPLPRGVASFSSGEIYEALAHATSINDTATTDTVARWMRSLHGREDISNHSLAGRLKAMREAGYVGSGKRKGAVDPNEHNIWWTIKSPPE